MKINDRLFITKVKRPGVIKEFLSNGKIKMTYFNRRGQRKFIDVGFKDVELIRVSNKEYLAIMDLHRKFGSPYATSPTPLLGASSDANKMFAQKIDEISKKMKSVSEKRIGGQVMARSSWMLEELAEFLTAESIEDQADALIDLIYFAYGTFVEMGLRPDKLFDIVHAANIGKLWPDGKPRFNEQGKWVKPLNWEAPEPKIKKEIEKQIRQQSV